MIVAIGETQGCLQACNPESGNRLGEILGVNGTMLCGVLTDKKTLFSAGEGNELLMHKGPMFKGQGVQIDHPHTGFINQMRLSPDGSKFATCSADKTIAVFESETGSLIKHYKACHAQGIYDLCWVSDKEFYTCSADNNVKKWSLDTDAAVKELTQGDKKRDISRQVLALKNFNGEHLLGFNFSGQKLIWDD